MDLDPDIAWPFWKFGLKKDDLFTTLHDQYNTFPSSIQDPEAFHHDVFECSQQACTTEEFHRLLATRKEQRLHELNTSLESASIEIIANPSLIGTEQWQFALQLFRTKSLDSLVRYFSSYLPDNHPWRDSESGQLSGSNNDVKSKIHSSTADETPLFESLEDEVLLTHEPVSIADTIQHTHHLPPSPRSMTMCSDISSSGDTHHHTYILNNLTPARTLSFSGSESEPFGLRSRRQDSHDEDESQPCDPETPISEYSEPFSETASFDVLDKDDVVVAEATPHDCPAAPTAPAPAEVEVSETPTPKPEAHAIAFFDARPSPAHRRGYSYSPSRPEPMAQTHSNEVPSDDCAKLAVSARLRRRDHSPGRGRRMASPGERSLARIQKVVHDHVGSRHRGRRRLAEC